MVKEKLKRVRGVNKKLLEKGFVTGMLQLSKSVIRIGYFEVINLVRGDGTPLPFLNLLKT